MRPIEFYIQTPGWLRRDGSLELHRPVKEKVHSTPGSYCHFSYAYSQSDRRQPAMGFSSFSLLRRPAPLFFAFIEGTKLSVTSQIAVKMSLDAMCSSAMDAPAEARSSHLIQSGFRSANKSVYGYGAKMLSAARIAATGFCGCFDGERFCLGRAGDYEGYLVRSGRVNRVYQPGSADEKALAAGQALGRIIGANKQIAVDLASVKVEQGDLLVVTSIPDAPWITAVLQQRLPRSFSRIDEEIVEAAKRNLKPAEGGAMRNVFCYLLYVDETPIDLRTMAR